MIKTINTYQDGKIVKTETVEVPDEISIDAQIDSAKTVDELKAILKKVL